MHDENFIDESLFCKDCVNFLELEKGTCECDYDVWEKIAITKSELYTCVLFECPFGERSFFSEQIEIGEGKWKTKN